MVTSVWAIFGDSPVMITLAPMSRHASTEHQRRADIHAADQEPVMRRQVEDQHGVHANREGQPDTRHDVEPAAPHEAVVLPVRQHERGEGQCLGPPGWEAQEDKDGEAQQDETAEDARHRPAATGGPGTAAIPP